MNSVGTLARPTGPLPRFTVTQNIPSTAALARPGATDRFAAAPAAKATAPTQVGFTAPNWSDVRAEKVHEDYSRLAYTVAPGDTLESIAATLGTTADILSQWNWENEDRTKVTPGQKLPLPTTYRTAKPGDTWASVARAYGLDAAALAAVNEGPEPKPGTELMVPGVATTAEQANTLASIRTLMADAAEADSLILQGSGAMKLSDGGYNLSWGFGETESTYYQFADDLGSVKVMAEDRDDFYPLSSPVDGMRTQLIGDLMKNLGGLYLYQKGGDDESNQVETKDVPGGGVKVDITGKVRMSLVYDPASSTFSALGGGDGAAWTGRAQTPMDLLELAKHLGMTLPVFPPLPAQPQ